MSPDAPAAWLIDAWGQLHPLGVRCRVGRDPERSDLVIAHLTVSAEHAELRRDPGGWQVRDRGSSNGTGVGDRPRLRDGPLSQRDRIWFGSVSFYFWAKPDPPATLVPPPAVRTLAPGRAAFRLDGPAGTSIVVRAVRGHPIDRAPGELECAATGSGRGRRAALPRLQFQLLRALCEAALLADGDERAGYVGTAELLCTLPFQSAHPEPNHVRQVVATLRATLERAGVAGAGAVGGDGLIHATEGLGYRIAWAVSPVAPEG